MSPEEEARGYAALARSEAVAQRSHRPSQRRSAESEDAPRRAPVSLLPLEIRGPGQEIEGGPEMGTHVCGLASVTERGYDMWDEFGAYTEVVSATAFDATLARNPIVEFTLNHNRGGGAPMASTRNGTLSLEAVKDGDATGLAYDADVDPSRSDVSDMVKALRRGDLAEASFKFGIVRGQWSPDFTEYRIEEVDLNGGDVTAANFGANPSATSSLRAATSPKPGSALVTERDLAKPERSIV